MGWTCYNGLGSRKIFDGVGVNQSSIAPGASGKHGPTGISRVASQETMPTTPTTISSTAPKWALAFFCVHASGSEIYCKTPAPSVQTCQAQIHCFLDALPYSTLCSWQVVHRPSVPRFCKSHIMLSAHRS